MSKINVIGAGTWGMALARMLSNSGHEVKVWSALPEEIMSCFERCIPTGIRHGTVTVILNHMQAEVTTYRTDGTYADGRHPEQVLFVRSLAEDLARRDFTINAMAMDFSWNASAEGYLSVYNDIL